MLSSLHSKTLYRVEITFAKMFLVMTGSNVTIAAFVKCIYCRINLGIHTFKWARKQTNKSISCGMNSFQCCHVVQVVFHAVRWFPSHSLLAMWNRELFLSKSIHSVTLLKVRLDLYLPSSCLVAKRLCCMNYAQYFGRLYISVSTAFSQEN